MNIKELLFPLSLLLFTTIALQYYFSPKDASSEESIKSGQRFVAPKKQEIVERKPLNLEVDFKDSKATRKSLSQEINTSNAFYEFSNDGASLVRAEFRRTWARKKEPIETIFPVSSVEKEKSAFLIALQEQTPYYYQFIEKKEQPDSYSITYKADFDGGSIYKTFVVFKDTYKLDLEISFKFKEGTNNKIQPRIIFPSPLMPEMKRQDIITGITNNERNSISVIQKNEQNLESYWAYPTLFGTQNRYFIHALVADPDHFVRRGYYKIVDFENLYSILEGPEISQDSSWKLSFYVGPKEDDAMAAVDYRLEQTLNYGWFSFISKPVSKLLLEILNFVNDYVHNYGIAIILLTLLMKIFLFPFTYRAEEGMKKRAEIQKKMDHLRSKYKNDPQALAAAQAELIRKHGLPGLGGLLTMFLQLPIFWALSIILANAIELYKAPFLWIPDLSVKDPYYILPFLMAVSIIFHSQAADPKQRFSTIFIGILVAALLSNIAAGCLVYIVTSTVLGIAQSMMVRRLKLV
jgi:YidC/Oxa1 family membrane protein insertase